MINDSLVVLGGEVRIAHAELDVEDAGVSGKERLSKHVRLRRELACCARSVMALPFSYCDSSNRPQSQR